MKNLTFGRRSQETTTKNSHQAVLKASDIVSIIQACKDSNVKSFEFDGLCISFGAVSEVAPEQVPIIPSIPATPSKDEQKDLNKFNDELNQLQMLLTDPEAHEDSLILG